MMEGDVANTLEPQKPAKKRQMTIASMVLARAVASVKRQKQAKVTRKTGRRPNCSERGAYRRRRRPSVPTHLKDYDEGARLTKMSGPAAKPSW
jgi:hypothetical protein